MISIGNSFVSIDETSELIFKQKEFALIGVSPFNSYFSVANIVLTIKIVLKHFNDFAIFIPDKISRYNLEAIGYTNQRASYRVRKQDNYLKNKVNKAIEVFHTSYQDKVVLLSDLSRNNKYIDLYAACMNQFSQDQKFRNGCLDTSNWILESYAKERNLLVNEDNSNIAVQYFLEELPIFLGASEMLNVDSCSFVYHSIPDFLMQIYSQYSHLVSNNQSFTTLKQFSSNNKEKIYDD
ncbi:MAG: tRNA-dependent cyclodipeptide synthase [Rickettsiaceae bacterium]|nr:MAG: tRNA-dependent cyclodipeptide synthase [Rickettsiaceae bacterium]